MPVSPPAAGQVDSELRRSQTQCCDLALGGCPASCPDAHRPTHGHRHVRNWAIAHISDVYALDKNFFRLRSTLAARRDAARASPRARASSAAGGEGLDASGVADERDHDGDAAGEEDALHDV